MTEADPLETELASMRPHAPSSELRDRIGDQLAVIGRRRSLRFRIAAAIGGAIAACLATAVWLRPPQANRIVTQAPAQFEPVHLGPLHNARPRVTAFSGIANPFDSSLPTFWTYSRALTGPSPRLEELLNKHSQTLHPANHRGWHVGFLMSDFRPVNGEL